MANVGTQRVGERRLPVLRLEHLWAIFALCAVSGFISLVPTEPNDFWWHLKAGELVATSGIPTTNLFAWSLPADHPYVYQSWLGEWLFYVCYRLGGLPLTIFARNLLGTLAYGLVAVEAQRRSGSWRLAAGAVALAALMTINNFTTRTQIWSWVPFMLILTIVARYVDGQLGARFLLALPVLMVFWVNVHGAFVMGILVVGAFVAGETLRRLLRQPFALSWERLRPLYLALLAMFLATLVNPLGVGVFSYVRTLLSDSSSQSLITEWQTPNPRDMAGAFFYLGVLGLVAAFAFARRRPTISDVLLVCGLAWQAFVGVRYVVWFGLTAMPIVVQSFARPRVVFSAEGASPPRQTSGRERGGGAMGNMLVAGLLVGLVLLVQPWLKPLLPLPEPYLELFAPTPDGPLLFSEATPVAAAEHLRAQPCAGRLFNEMGYGSYFSWALYPQTQVFIDPRVELYPLAQWEDYIRITQGRELPVLLDRYQIGCIALDRKLQPALAKAMPSTAGWTKSFGDDQSEVWRR